MNIRTRILVLSDTHACDVGRISLPTHRADVAIHCGDLTEGSSLEDIYSALRLLKAINAPLKLVIPGNQGIVLLKEGVHAFRLAKGASLTVYASAYTPALGAWGFQYHPDKGHKFQIPREIDVVMTHGPPKGIMDYTNGRERAGCPDLFTAIARSRSRLHCFGHIHEGWGAKLVTWKDDNGEPSHFASIDNDRTTLIAKLSSLNESRFDTPEEVAMKHQKKRQINEDRCIVTSHCEGDILPVAHGVSTLFVNASVCDNDGRPSQSMWLVDLDLPPSQ